MRFRIDLKIFIFLAIFYFTNQLNTYIATMFFCFLHEVGHLLMGIFLGFKPEKMEMIPFGFCLEFKHNTQKGSNEKLKSNILIAIAGPLTNVIIIFMTMFLQTSFMGKDVVVYINLLILALNLIPIYPLDGGRVLKGILDIFNKDIKSDIFINKVSNIYMVILTMIGSIAIYYFKNIAILIIIGYLWTLVIRENKRISIKRRMWELKKV